MRRLNGMKILRGVTRDGTQGCRATTTISDPPNARLDIFAVLAVANC